MIDQHETATYNHHLPWVNVDDRLPTEADYGDHGDVLVRYRYNTPNSVLGDWDVGESHHDADDLAWNNGWLFGSCDYAEVSHWMPKSTLLDLIDSQALTTTQPNLRGRTLYIDLDGVMADFDGAFPAIFGLNHRSMADDDMWLHINGHPSFFRDLPPMEGAIEFFREVEHLNPVILTACPKSNYPHVAAQKRAWVREHLSQTCMVLPVLGGRHKALFMHQAGDVLIDDFGKNCAAWDEAGGVAIKHEGDWSATRAALARSDRQEVR